jgi:phage repressor protein C with HTH and peptisase S24 domain
VAKLDISFKDVMENISSVLEIELGSKPQDKQIAYALGLSPQQYANQKHRNSIPYAEIGAFCQKYQITMNWILYGSSSEKMIENEEKIYKARLINKINISGGGGAYDDEEISDSYIYLNESSVKSLGIQNMKNIDAIKVVGDSMSPTIEDGELVLIDRNDKIYQESSVFAINTYEGLFAKRLAVNSQGDMDLISDNKSYTAITMPIDEVYIIGKIIGVLEKL